MICIGQKNLRSESPETVVFGIEEATARLMMGLEKPEGDKIFTSSDVTPIEIFGLNLIRAYGEMLDSKITGEWIRYHLLLRISRLRIGRKESILLGSGLKEMSERKGKGKLSDLFSGFK